MKFLLGVTSDSRLSDPTRGHIAHDGSNYTQEYLFENHNAVGSSLSLGSSSPLFTNNKNTQTNAVDKQLYLVER
jgi:hypothetical protein